MGFIHSVRSTPLRLWSTNDRRPSPPPQPPGRRQARSRSAAGARPAGGRPAARGGASATIGQHAPHTLPPNKTMPHPNLARIERVAYRSRRGHRDEQQQQKNENDPPYRSPNRTATRPPTWPTQLCINMPNADVSIYATLHTSPHRDVCDSTHTTTKAFQTSPVRRTCRSLPHVPFKDLEWPNVTTDVDALIEHVENRTCRNPSTSET